MSRDRDASFGRLSRGVSCSYLASCCKQLITSLILAFVDVCMYVHATVYLCVHEYGYLYMLHGKGALIFVGWFVLLFLYIWCILFGYICMFLFLHACVCNIIWFLGVGVPLSCWDAFPYFYMLHWWWCNTMSVEPCYITFLSALNLFSLYTHILYTLTHKNTHNMQVEHAGWVSVLFFFML